MNHLTLSGAGPVGDRGAHFCLRTDWRHYWHPEVVVPCDEAGIDITKGVVSIKCVESIDKKRAGKDNPRLRYSSNSGYVAQLVRAQHS